MNVVIELHGAQHYRPVNFGGIGYDQLLVEFRRGLYRDGLKEHAARQAGLLYIAIPYTIKKFLSQELLMKLIQEASLEQYDNEDSS